MKKYFIPFIISLLGNIVHSQTTNDILNILTASNTITQETADSLRADAAIKQQDAEAAKKTFQINAARPIQIAGYTQLRYQILDEKGKKDGFDIRRARLDVKGNLTPYFSYRLQTDFADKPKMIDAYAEIKIADYFNITAGQFKIPFSLENLASSNKLEMIDRSQVVEALSVRGKDVIGNHNGRDIGIQIGGILVKNATLSILEYRLAVFNGSGINVADTANEAKDVAARLILNPVKGLSFGASYYNGWCKAIKPATEFKGKSQERSRFGMEASYTSATFTIKGEYIQGTDGNTKREGWYVMAGYFLVPQKLQVLVKYDTYDADKSLADNISTNYVFGANLNFNTWSRLQAFYTIRQEEGTSVNNNYFALQYQIGF